jgi:hypothetical protein
MDHGHDAMPCAMAAAVLADREMAASGPIGGRSGGIAGQPAPGGSRAAGLRAGTRRIKFHDGDKALACPIQKTYT